MQAVLRGGFMLPQKVSSLGEASLRYFLGDPELLRMRECEFEAFLDMTKTLSECSYTSHHIFSKTELRACTRTYLFEAFLHSRQLGTG